jgi:hypothetical protein
MKKLVKCEEVEGEGLLSLLGEEVMVWCMNYNYHGKLIGVNEHDIILEGGGIVFETGRFDGPIKDKQQLPGDCYVRIAAIESYCKYEEK